LNVSFVIRRWQRLPETFMSSRALAALGLLISFAFTAAAQEPSAADAEFFAKTVRPILQANCFTCHSHEAKKGRGQLMLDSRAALLRGGESGPALDAKEPEKSLLLKAIAYKDEELQMPPRGKMSDEEIAVLEAWVKKGAPWPGAGSAAAKTGRVPGQITDEDRRWWAFQPVKPTTPPQVADPAWSVNPVDRFVYDRLVKEGLKPAPVAERIHLIRRVTFDLIGLPPAPEEIESFVSDPDPRAYEKLVDRLLASPHYAERMARHWLDFVRYAESDGFRLDSYRPSSWRYRDYVIRSFHEDRPYDRFVREQLAGDELRPDDPEAHIATGFLAHGIYEFNQRDVKNQWNDIVNEVTDVTSDVFLALGMGCARCHDHKYDPILQKDYFRLRAFFEPILVLQEEPVIPPAAKKEYDAKLANWMEKTKKIRAEIDAIEEPVRQSVAKMMVSKFPKDLIPLFAKSDAERTPYEKQLYALAWRQVTYEWDRLDTRIKGEKKDRLLELRKELAKFDKDRPSEPVHAQLVRDVGPEAPPTMIPKKSGGPIAPGFLTILDDRDADVTPRHSSTGRRTALANWIADPKNPLTARVLVNRLWQMHFGKGLVATSSDFGKLGEPPSHPELLDFLADHFVKSGWSVKTMHRLMVTSQTYQQSALHPAPDIALKKDPENRLLWRMGTRRLDAEQIRDALLATVGKLDLSQGGPSVEPREPRRTIYTKVLRNSRDPLLDVFDSPEGFSSTAERNVTTTATQSLLLINSTLMQQYAKSFADRLLRDKSATDEELIGRAIQSAFGRPATPRQLRLGVEFLREQAKRISPPPAGDTSFELAKLPLREGRAMVFTPGPAPVHMRMPETGKLPKGDFTLEAFVLLRSTFETGTVRTLAAQSSGDPKASSGWVFGVTSKKSAYKPQALVLQLWGKNKEGKLDYEPVFSSLQIALNKPYYLAVSVKLDDTSESGITFYAKDLTNDEEPVQIYQTSHKIVELPDLTMPFTIGGLDGKTERAWDGLIDDVRLSRGVLKESQLLLAQETVREDTVGFWQFEKTGAMKDSSANGLHLVRLGGAVRAVGADARTAALADFCLVLLNASEFLYVD
jgi:cytochrome c553